MKILTRLLLSVVISCAAFSCSNDFLDLENPNELTASNFYSRIENFELALNGTYDAVKNLDLFGQNFYIQTLLALPHESDYWAAQNRNEVTSIDGNVYVAWRGFYRIVARANDIIENAPKFEESGITTSDTQRLHEIVAEAKFLRGLAYFHLVRLWGEESFAVDSTRLAVPLILKVATVRSEMMVPRATVGKVYNQILSDFEAAESGLPETWDASNIARISKSAMKGFIGQLYLYMGNNAKAKTYFEVVINNAAYELVPFNKYDDLFHGKAEFSKESLWELNYTIDMQLNIWENGLGSGIALVIAAPGRGWSNCTPHGVNIDRFGSDPRLKINTYAPTDIVATKENTMEPAGVSAFNFTGHSFRKYSPYDYCVYTTNQNSGTNYLMLRLADVYLMYAEVMNNLNDNVTAAEYMNRVRRRAYGFNYTVPEPSVDYTGLPAVQLRDSIREERFRELFAEGHRWYDICRWKIVEEEVVKYNDKRKTQGVILYEPKDYYYPVPLQEVDNNANMKPSTGYN